MKHPMNPGLPPEFTHRNKRLVALYLLSEAEIHVECITRLHQRLHGLVKFRLK